MHAEVSRLIITSMGIFWMIPAPTHEVFVDVPVVPFYYILSFLYTAWLQSGGCYGLWGFSTYYYTIYACVQTKFLAY